MEQKTLFYLHTFFPHVPTGPHCINNANNEKECNCSPVVIPCRTLDEFVLSTAASSIFIFILQM